MFDYSDELPDPRRIAFLGNYLPRRCGIATFTHDLCEAVARAVPDSDCFVAAVNDCQQGYAYPPRVRCELQQKELDTYRHAADFLNFQNGDILCVQHEFGIYGGAAGSHLLALLKEVRMPVVTTLHTILRDPDAAQRMVMAELTARSDRLVVMARKGKDILRDVYNVPGEKVDMIPHGIPDVPFADSGSFKARFGVEGRHVLLTFGLLGPDKGIEYVIEALPAITRRHPDVVYIILGATHPHLVAHEGERYRLGLERLAKDLGVEANVIFSNRFVSLEDLEEFIGAADVYLTPYLNPAQITSGTLAYVFGAGKAVVSTPYWHARELLADGRGVLVPFRDAGAIVEAVCDLLDHPQRLNDIRRKAYAVGRSMIWSETAHRYLESFRRARAEHEALPRTAFAGWTLQNRPCKLPSLRLDHILNMTDSIGIFQHAIFNVPNFHEGYCVDDNARAFILCNLLDEIGGRGDSKVVERLTAKYLAFVAAAFDYRSGRFRNFMSHGHHWLEKVGSEDSHGRALWATGVGVGRSPMGGHARLSAQLFDRGLPVVEAFTSPRAWAFALLGIHEYHRREGSEYTHATRVNLTGKLVALWENVATEDWPWFETSITYENARLCQALILSGQWIPDPKALAIGLKSLSWLVSIQTTPAGVFRPIGNDGFYPRGGRRADFDQQPVEALAMVSACLEAFRATRDSMWESEAKRAFEWFLGRNDLGLALYDFNTGGCCDGLHPDRLNENYGAESTLAFQLALVELKHAEMPTSGTPHGSLAGDATE